MKKPMTNEEFLKTYRASDYKTPDGYTADMAVFTITTEAQKKGKKPIRQIKLMLIKRASTHNIEAGKWALPGGFVQENETGSMAAVRELQEEATVSGFHLSHFGVYDKPGRDPRGWIISNAFVAIVKEEMLEHRAANDDAEDVGLFTMDEIVSLDLAFDHEQIIKDAYQVVKRDLLTTTLAKHFLPTQFPLSALLDLLQLVSPTLDKKDKSSFFRKAKNNKLSFLRPVEDTKSSKFSFKPSTLYEFLDVEPEAPTIY